MRTQLDMDKIARGLGAERQGKVVATGGYFGAVQLLAEIESRFRVPAGGGRSTDPSWTKRRQIPLTPRTLASLDLLSARLQERLGISIGPMQLAALLLEKTTERLDAEEALVGGEAPL